MIIKHFEASSRQIQAKTMQVVSFQYNPASQNKRELLGLLQLNKMR